MCSLGRVQYMERRNLTKSGGGGGGGGEGKL